MEDERKDLEPIRKLDIDFWGKGKEVRRKSSPYVVENFGSGSKWRNYRVPRQIEYVDTETGELHRGVQVVGERYRIDSAYFVKLYSLRVLRMLSRAGVAVFSYMCERIRYDGTVPIDVRECVKELGYGNSKSVYNGIQELLGLDVIRRKSQGEYYVNPNVVYRGDRTGIKKI